MIAVLDMNNIIFMIAANMLIHLTHYLPLL